MNVIILIAWVFAGGVLGYQLCSSYKKRMEVFQDISNLLSETTSNLENQKRPLLEVLKEFRYKSSLEQILSNQDYKSQHIKKETQESVKTLFDTLPELEGVVAIKKLKEFKIKNDENLAIAKEEYIKKGVTYQKLGILFGLLVGILWI